MHTLAENYKVLSLARPATRTSTLTGTAVDTLGYGDDAMLVVDLGAASDTDATLICKLQSSATSGGTYADISGSTLTTLTATDDNKLAQLAVNLKSANRFVKLIGTIAGTGTPSFAFSAYLIVKAEQGKAALSSATAA